MKSRKWGRSDESLYFRNQAMSAERRAQWLYYAARTAVEQGLTDSEAEAIIEQMMSRPPFPASEVKDALRSARGGRSEAATPQWPSVNVAQVEALTRRGMTVRGLWEASPFPCCTGENHTEEAIDALFPGNPLLCVGQTPSICRTAKRQKLKGSLKNFALIVPSPMTAEVGLTNDGRKSPHSLSNTGARRYLVIENDQGSLDQQAAIIGHLAGFAPLAAVVFSGSKSLHGWFCTKDVPEIVS